MTCPNCYFAAFIWPLGNQREGGEIMRNVSTYLNQRIVLLSKNNLKRYEIHKLIVSKNMTFGLYCECEIGRSLPAFYY